MATVKSKVVVQVGLISTQVSLDSGVDKAESLTTLCVGQPEKKAHDAAAVKHPVHCPECGPVTDFTVLKKGVKAAGGYALVNAEDVAEAKMRFAADCDKVIDLVAHPREEVEELTTTGGKLYYLRPTASRGGYDILCALVDAHPELAFTGLFAPRTAPALFAARVSYDANGEAVLVLAERAMAENVRALPVMAEQAQTTAKEQAAYDANLGFAEQIVAASIQPFEAGTYVDQAGAEVKALLEAADVVASGDVATTKQAVAVTADDDLTTKLAAQLAALNEGALKDGAPTPKPPRKRAAAQKKEKVA